MSHNPFTADAELQARHAANLARIGDTAAAEIVARAGKRNADWRGNAGALLASGDAAELIARYGLTGVEDLMILALQAARRLARPPLSDFFVGAVGLERETGDLILGGNVEFPGAALAFTLHGEGFVFARAFSRGTTIGTIAIGEAHPCAHCRQFISEFSASRDLKLIDPLGHRLSMAQLYPWPFDPDYLGEPGIVAGQMPYPALRFTTPAPPDDVAERLLGAGRRAHAPYGKSPAAVVLQLADGAMFGGSVIESVSFNPGLVPMQAALVDLLAHGRNYDEIVHAWLGRVEEGRVGFVQGSRELLSAMAPAARLEVVGWQV